MDSTADSTRDLLCTWFWYKVNPLELNVLSRLLCGSLINLARSKVATASLVEFAQMTNSDFLLVQEPYIRNERIEGLPRQWTSWLSGNGNAAADLEEMIKELEEALSKLQDENVIIGADINAHCVRWGYRTNNNRGYQMENFIVEKNLQLLNSPGAEPTFQHYNAEDWPDLTLASNPILANMCDWEVLENESFSDHNFIKIIIKSETPILSYLRFKKKFGGHKKFYIHFKEKIHKLLEIIHNADTIKDLDAATEKLQLEILDSCVHSYYISKNKKIIRKTVTLNKQNVLHPHQFGFREGKSFNHVQRNLLDVIEDDKKREHYVIAISLDIQGAFDNLKYDIIRKELRKLYTKSNISEPLEDILSNRKVAIQTSDGLAVGKQTQGCPQGSCTSLFWNIVSDEILKTVWPKEIHLQAFTDDFAFAISGRTRRELEQHTSFYFETFKIWTDKNQFNTSIEK
ncbi:hypothetical protein AVEN_225313-1 [Araneus ventricosus]|uniref:Reverse transcriptase domain-containing protein n=1 Tax=Araneus ventricosus TaxID=182803 RepID=A0A4Y2ALF9_ARAVE|nr:hypothetical protein AVEN_225313-1 [Araneus ventricosus]